MMKVSSAQVWGLWVAAAILMMIAEVTLGILIFESFEWSSPAFVLMFAGAIIIINVWLGYKVERAFAQVDN